MYEPNERDNRDAENRTDDWIIGFKLAQNGEELPENANNEIEEGFDYYSKIYKKNVECSQKTCQ